MAFLNRIILSLLAALPLVGCFSDFEPDIESTPVLCLNSLITAGEPVQVSVTRTWRWSEGNPDDTYHPIDIDIADADVSLIVNGKFVERLTFTQSDNGYDPGTPFYKLINVYQSTYCPRSGDTVMLRAVSDRYGEATAQVTVPDPAPIDKVDVKVKDFSDNTHIWQGDYSMSLGFRIWFTDPADATDYYLFETDHTESHFTDAPDGERAQEYIMSMWVDYTCEPLFTEHVSALESVFSDTSGYTIFSDRQISGKSYPLNVSVDNITYIYYNPDDDPDLGDMAITLSLCSISDSYYYHVLSVWHANDGISGVLGGVGLGDPVYAASNVSTGAGVVAAVAKSTFKVRLLDIIGQQSNYVTQ